VVTTYEDLRPLLFALSVQVRALCVSCVSLLFCFYFFVNERPGGKSVSLLVFGKCITLMKSAASVLICTFAVTSCSGCGTLWTVLFE
jgi:hypothetical protein